ncbi:MAG: branched-chain amino acid ABC transporter permease [Deltaproteobacteria bacterium]|nr:MAG: branched-chain amino acid ABC transporter permease [Deltaproteobacteria bacterium]
MREPLVILLDGLVYSSWLFIVSAGLTLIYGVMRILNMAHGSLYAVGAYTAASVVGWYFASGYDPTLSYLVFFTCAAGAGVLAGLIIERGILRVVYGRDEVLVLLVTYAVLLILEDVIKLIWGVDAYFAYQPYAALGRTKILGIPFANYDLLLILLAAGTGALLWFGLNRTRQGKFLRAVIHDREVSEAMGINVTRLYTATFVIGSALAALGGAVTAPSLSVVPGIGVEVIVIAFAVVVTGGLGSIGGTLLGSLLIGLTRAAAVHLFPRGEVLVIFVIMAAVLAVRPEGIFARVKARKI